MQRTLGFTLLATAIFLTSATGAAYALCPIEQQQLDTEVSPFCGGGGGGGGGGDRQCTAALPIPADAFDCACKTVNVDPTRRCNEPLPLETCNSMISSAFSLGLITSDAVTFLQNNGFCPIVADVGSGPRIYDFCPAGCFAADTRMLTSAGRGKTRYTPASEITSRDMLMSMTDESSLEQVSMAARPIKRAVHGPEKPPLYVFGLSNGSTLRVTQHHPMVLDNGQIIEANQVDRQMSFVGLDGKSVAITSITREPAIGDVFNFQVAGDTQLSHVIAAEGVLVGDLKLQNELEAEQAAIELRR